MNIDLEVLSFEVAQVVSSIVLEAQSGVFGLISNSIQNKIFKKVLGDQYSENSFSILLEATSNQLTNFYGENYLTICDPNEVLRCNTKGIPVAYERFAQLLSTIGKKGGERAKEVRINGYEWFNNYKEKKDITKLLRLFDTNKLRFLGLIAKSLWEDSIQEKIQFPPTELRDILNNIKKPMIMDNISQLSLSFDNTDEALTVPGELLDLLTISKKDIVQLEKGFAIAHLDGSKFISGVNKLGNSVGIDLYSWLKYIAWKQDIIGDYSPQVIEIEGGRSMLAKMIGHNKPTARKDIQDILYFYSKAQFKFKDGSIAEGLLNYTERRPSKGQKAHLTITLSTHLLPGYNFSRKTRQSRHFKYSKQHIPLPQYWPKSTSPRTAGDEKRLFLFFFSELRYRADEFVLEGGWLFGNNDWEQLANSLKVSKKTCYRAVKQWVKEGHIIYKGARFTLGNMHHQQLETIKQGGTIQLTNSQRKKLDSLPNK